MTAGDTKDITLKWIDLVLNQTSDLWAVALTFLIADLLVIAGLHAAQLSPTGEVAQEINRNGVFGKIFVFGSLYVSLLATMASLIFCYMQKGGLISLADKIARDQQWQIPPGHATNAAGQSISLAVAVVLFFFAFVLRRRLIGSALLGGIRG